MITIPGIIKNYMGVTYHDFHFCIVGNKNESLIEER